MPENIGVVGLGSLGLAIAVRLIEQGHKVIGFRRSAMTEFAVAGGIPASSIEDLVRQVDLVLTLLPSTDALEEVYCGTGGIIRAARPGLIAIDLSTVSMIAKRRIETAAETAGLGMLEGTVSGNPTYIHSRNAAIFIGGNRELFDRHAAVLRQITDKVTWVGSFGAGRVAKFVALYLVAVHTLAAAEAFELATQAGLDRSSIAEALSGSNATSAMLESRGKHMIDRSYASYNPTMHAAARAKGEAPMRGFASRTRQLARLAKFAHNLGGHYPLLTAMSVTYQAALERKVGKYDIVEIFEYLMSRAPAPIPEARLIDIIDQLS